MTPRFSQAVSTSVFRGVTGAECERQAEAENAEARTLGYEPISQAWSEDSGIKVLTVVYRYKGGPVFGRPALEAPASVRPPAAPTTGNRLSIAVRIVLGVSGVLLLLVAIGSFIGVGGGTILGTFTLTQTEDVDTIGGGCQGTGGYSDIASDRSIVTVKNESGTILATATLTNGIGSGFICRLSFTVKVPTAKFYSVEVGRRGALTYSYDEMVGQNWHVDLTLGK